MSVPERKRTYSVACAAVRVKRGSHDDHVAAVDLLRGEEMLHRDRVRLGRVAADEDHRLGVADVVVGVGLRAVAPGVGDAGDRRRVADARLVVDRVRAPEGAELAEQIGALVGELGRAEPEDRIRAVLAADVHQLVADLVDRLIPRDPLPLAVDELHRVFQPAVAVHDLADRRALGAVRAAVDRALPGRLLAGPDAVLDLGRHRAADRAVGADVLLDARFRTPGCRAVDRLAPCAPIRAGSSRPRRGRRPRGPSARGSCAGRCASIASPAVMAWSFAAARFAVLALDQHGRLTSSASRSRSCGRRP